MVLRICLPCGILIKCNLFDYLGLFQDIDIYMTDSSQCNVLVQLRRARTTINRSALRFDNLAASPYPTYSKYELDMRRKAEILQYKATNKNTMQNNLTKSQLYSQIVN